MDIQAELRRRAELAKAASYKLGVLSTAVKNQALLAMADALEQGSAQILAANAQDMASAREKGIKSSYLDRLLLDESRIAGMAEGLRQTAALPDPVGYGDSSSVRPNGLAIRRVHVPLGVVGIIYEARPNVTADALGLCLKSGNAVLLRGGSEALHSNIAISSLLAQAAYANGIPEGAVQFVDFTDREAVGVMTHLTGLLDVIIPRGGAGLIKRVVEDSSVPVIETGTGVCHTFVDESA
ncbi:MAG: glutamate-5-semialdehyde dehydrogenase, partial [Selenomonas sp.]|nr:glutamate-5-semialdehyde dehydrogenase [Selenomonas sp.]